jgi:hypothetical protein
VAHGALPGARRVEVYVAIAPGWIAVALAFAGVAYWWLMAPSRAHTARAAALQGMVSGFMTAATLAGVFIAPALFFAALNGIYAEDISWLRDFAMSAISLLVASAAVGALLAPATRWYRRRFAAL